MSKKITGIVNLTEYDSNYYFIEDTCIHIPKIAVKLISDQVDSVQPEVKGWEPKVGEWAYINKPITPEHEANNSNLSTGAVFCITGISESSVFGNRKWLETKPSEEGFGIIDSFCRKAEPHEIPTASAKLIAKAGEHVKIVDFGDAEKDENEFSLNTPYELREDLFEGGAFRVVKCNNGLKNGFSKYPAETMKFEVCPAPVQRKSIGFYGG